MWTGPRSSRAWPSVRKAPSPTGPAFRRAQQVESRAAPAAARPAVRCMAWPWLLDQLAGVPRVGAAAAARARRRRRRRLVAPSSSVAQRETDQQADDHSDRRRQHRCARTFLRGSREHRRLHSRRSPSVAHVLFDRRERISVVDPGELDRRGDVAKLVVECQQIRQLAARPRRLADREVVRRWFGVQVREREISRRLFVEQTPLVLFFTSSSLGPSLNVNSWCASSSSRSVRTSGSGFLELLNFRQLRRPHAAPSAPGRRQERRSEASFTASSPPALREPPLPARPRTPAPSESARLVLRAWRAPGRRGERRHIRRRCSLRAARFGAGSGRPLPVRSRTQSPRARRHQPPAHAPPAIRSGGL